MNSQCCGSWMCWWVFGSRALRSTCLRLPPKEGERRVVLWAFFVVWLFLWFLLFCLFVGFFFLLPAADCLFCWSHSAVDELSTGSVSEEQTLCICYAQVTAKTAMWGHLNAPSGPFLLLPMVWVICTFACLQPLAGLAWVQNSSKDKQ